MAHIYQGKGMKPLSAAAFVGWHSADELKHQMCCVYSLSPVWLFAEARQAPLSMGILQARILEWVAMPSSRGIFPTQESNPGLPHCR